MLVAVSIWPEIIVCVSLIRTEEGSKFPSCSYEPRIVCMNKGEGGGGFPMTHRLTIGITEEELSLLFLSREICGHVQRGCTRKEGLAKPALIAFC